jgi:hypothetical protein
MWLNELSKRWLGRPTTARPARPRAARRRGHPFRRRPGVRLALEPLEARNLLDGGFANVLVNDPSADHPVTAVVNGTTVVETRDTQSETTLALGANGRVMVAFNDTGSESYSDGNYISGGIRESIGYAVSPNGGQHFQDKGTPPVNPYGFYSDPVLARSDKTGTVFLATLARIPFTPYSTEPRINIFRSSNDGSTFQQPVNGAPGFVQQVDNPDKPWLAVDNYPGPGYGNVYLAWRNYSSNTDNNGILVTRSTDDGLSWGPDSGIRIAEPGKFEVQGANVAVGPDHAVYIFWLDQSKGLPNPVALRMRKSTDQGVTFGDSFIVTGVKTGNYIGDLGLTDSSGNSFRTSAFPQAAVNRVTGDIYVIYPDQPNGSADKADIFFVESTDGGKKWSKPLRVNDDVTNNDQWQPALAVTPDGGHVGIFWYDRRLDPADNLIDRFGVIGTVSGHSVTFAPNFRITDVSFPPAFGQDPNIAPTYMGDYDQAVADNSFFYTTWGDNRLANPNYPSHANQPDVRLAKIPVTTLVTAPTSAAAVSDNPKSQMLTRAALGPIVILTEALARWGWVGVDRSAPHEIGVHTANLRGGPLGVASTSAIWPDSIAAGYDWIVDLRPAERRGMDLSTAQTREVAPLAQGHESEAQMAEALTAGTGVDPVWTMSPTSCVPSKTTGGARFDVEDFLGDWWGIDLAGWGPSPAILAAIL